MLYQNYHTSILKILNYLLLLIDLKYILRAKHLFQFFKINNAREED